MMRTTCLVAMVLAMAVFLFAPAGVLAQEEPREESGAVLLIMDASGSMNRVGETGRPLIDEAQDALVRLVKALPEGTAVGLRVYGHRVPNTDKVRGCRDTELVVPVGPLDREVMIAAIQGFEARGFTPIGLSLREAVGDFPEGGRRTVVLVSDGEDTCAPPEPCDVAHEIVSEGIDLRVETVGFLIEAGSRAESQLQCIAEATGGSYRTVGEAGELAGVLSRVVGEAVGGPVYPRVILDGALIRVEAPVLDLLEPDAVTLAEAPGRREFGNFLSLILPGETRWWKVELQEDEFIDVSGDLLRPVDLELAEGEAFELRVLDPDLEVVGYDRPGFGPTRADIEHREVAVRVWATMEGVDEVSGGPRFASEKAGTYYIGFTWEAPTGTVLGEVAFLVEVTERSAMGGPGPFIPFVFVFGSLTRESAPLLEPPPYAGPPESRDSTYYTRVGGYESAVRPGEILWYAIVLEAGEDVIVEARFPRSDLAEAEATGEFSVELYDPAGQAVGEAHSLIGPERIAMTSGVRQAVVSSTSEMRRAPREAGRYLVAFTWNGEPDQKETRFEFTVEVVVMPGAPTGEDEDSEAELDTVSETTAPERPDVPAETAGEELPAGVSPLGWLVGTGLGLLVVGAAVLAFLRRRRTTGNTT
ncbi:MAG: VWA domain-containing protein, partial [Actinomycetota bacterium]|nr:VWA domain-containing protein [Actinomycetota bacterium]